MSEFIALDVETANADYSSICQIGLVRFQDGNVIEQRSMLIDPQSYFDPFNVGIHGIDEQIVAGKQPFAQAFPEIVEFCNGSAIVHHGHFDRTAFSRCYDRFSLTPLAVDWMDCTKVVRRTWSEFSYSGYGLANLTHHFGIRLDHHDALSDATATGHIFNLALDASGKSIEDWRLEIKAPIAPAATASDIRRDGDPNAAFFGDKIVFTGALAVERRIAADVAQRLGFDVQSGVTKQTTYLCVGIQDLSSLAGYAKSSKHRKAEKLAAAGQEINILSEDDFWALAKVYETGEL